MKLRLSSEELPRQLAQGLRGLYVVHGDAFLLAIEASDMIRLAARQAGFTERDVLTVETHFKWAELRHCAQSQSLFADKKIIELRIASGKPGVDGAQAIQEHCANLSADTLTIVTLPRVDGTTQKSKWFAALEQHGVLVSADEISLAALPNWIAARLKRQQQFTDADTLLFLAQRVEGNLLAAFQEIQKLALLFPAGELSFEQVKDSVMDVARYDVFKLSEAMLAGDAARFVHILEGLRGEGTASVLILWAVVEDIRALAKVSRAMQQHGNLANALRDARIWGIKQKLVERAAKRFNVAITRRALSDAAKIDKIIKGLADGDEWDALLQLGVRCARAKPK